VSGQTRVRLAAVLALAAITAAIVAWAVVRARGGGSVAAIAADWSASGHADYSAEAFVHWDADDPPLIPAGCAECHSSHGLLEYVGERGGEYGKVSRDMPVGTVVSCVACHNNAVHGLTEVGFPSGEMLPARGSEGVCLICHQGTESGATVRAAAEGLPADEVSEDLAFVNVHYHVAAATTMGATATGGYEHEDTAYAGRYEHVSGWDTCTGCHDAHTLKVDPVACGTCHANVVDAGDLRHIRSDRQDYDGDGDTREGIAAEIAALNALLESALQEYAVEIVGQPLVYSAERYPYFFHAPAGDDGAAEVDPSNLTFADRYSAWTPRLLRNAYNHHMLQKDPGAYAHNPKYALQLLYDSIEDLSGAVRVVTEGLTRPGE